MTNALGLQAVVEKSRPVGSPSAEDIVSGASQLGISSEEERLVHKGHKGPEEEGVAERPNRRQRH